MFSAPIPPAARRSTSTLSRSNALFGGGVGVMGRVLETYAQAALLLKNHQHSRHTGQQKQRRQPAGPERRDVTELAHQDKSLEGEMGQITSQQHRHQREPARG